MYDLVHVFLSIILSELFVLGLMVYRQFLYKTPTSRVKTLETAAHKSYNKDKDKAEWISKAPAKWYGW